MRAIRALIGIFGSIFIALTAQFALAAEFNHSGVAIMYHRFGQDDYPSTNIRMEQLEAHIEELTSGNYNVMPLDKMIAALQAGEKLPDRSVAITIDDAFRSVYENGWPALRDAGLPVTLFVSDGPINEGRSDYVTWAQLQEMVGEGLQIAAHTVNHVHMASIDLKTVEQEVSLNFNRLKEKTGQTPTLFAYPYGEASREVIELVKKFGFVAAFGQHSGVMTAADNQFYLPRFAVNETYGEIDRFKTSLNAVGLAVEDVLPEDPFVAQGSDQNPPAMGFTLPTNIGNTDNLTCYHSKEGKVEDMQRIGKYRVELRFKDPLTAGRTRINCTLHAAPGRWYWYGKQFFSK